MTGTNCRTRTTSWRMTKSQRTTTRTTTMNYRTTTTTRRTMTTTRRNATTRRERLQQKNKANPEQGPPKSRLWSLTRNNERSWSRLNIVVETEPPKNISSSRSWKKSAAPQQCKKKTTGLATPIYLSASICWSCSSPSLILIACFWQSVCKFLKAWE